MNSRAKRRLVDGVKLELPVVVVTVLAETVDALPFPSNHRELRTIVPEKFVFDCLFVLWRM